VHLFQAATFEKLLEFLMQTTGSLALETFLISYRNFASSRDLLRRLELTYCKSKESLVFVSAQGLRGSLTTTLQRPRKSPRCCGRAC
jgi:hypothetical protein